MRREMTPIPPIHRDIVWILLLRQLRDESSILLVKVEKPKPGQRHGADHAVQGECGLCAHPRHEDSADLQLHLLVDFPGKLIKNYSVNYHRPKPPPEPVMQPLEHALRRPT